MLWWDCAVPRTPCSLRPTIICRCPGGFPPRCNALTFPPPCWEGGRWHHGTGCCWPPFPGSQPFQQAGQGWRWSQKASGRRCNCACDIHPAQPQMQCLEMELERFNCAYPHLQIAGIAQTLLLFAGADSGGAARDRSRTWPWRSGRGHPPSEVGDIAVRKATAQIPLHPSSQVVPSTDH